ncbi:uncharacterized protein A4U43_C03F16710 [Asparagus officinalis]|uniref:Small ribosomal subunit protein mS23 n=1 Tax=Asparagus officinalis TaxID=4686 RepID=A0A5P1FAN2_ASPOF|nr:uncharacterized protein LOC109833855 [Asparagus officinalis]ONK75425.1 uncharacterized protein A4U43_C03F16710 [Asparagus officinalis]
MSYMRGDLLTKTRKLVKGLAKPTPKWLKPMEQAPPVVFPRTDGKIKAIELPEDVYVKKFFKKHPDSLYHDAVKISGFEPPPARVFAWRVLELKDQGVNEEEAMAVADMEYRAEKKAKKNAYMELKKISPILGKRPPPNPYPSAIKEIQAEEKKYVRDRFFNPRIRDIVDKMKAEIQERRDNRNMAGGNQPGGPPGGGQRW